MGQAWRSQCLQSESHVSAKTWGTSVFLLSLSFLACKMVPTSQGSLEMHQNWACLEQSPCLAQTEWAHDKLGLYYFNHQRQGAMAQVPTFPCLPLLRMVGDGGTFLAQLVEHATLNHEVMSSSPMLGLELTLGGGGRGGRGRMAQEQHASTCTRCKPKMAVSQLGHPNSSSGPLQHEWRP